MKPKERELGALDFSSEQEATARKNLVSLLKETPIPDDELLENLGLFLNSKNLSRIMAMNHLYEQIINNMGVIMEFGTRWGQNMAIWTALRGIYEPYNRHREIIGFDTFEGFPSVDKKDGTSELMKEGNLALPENYNLWLEKLLTELENDNPLSHIKKFGVIKGDAIITVPKYLDENPHTIISLAFFDFDIYLPTKRCLFMILDRMPKGSIIAFDELNDRDSPGETLAVMEAIGLNKIKLKRYRYTSRISYFVVE